MLWFGAHNHLYALPQALGWVAKFKCSDFKSQDIQDKLQNTHKALNTSSRNTHHGLCPSYLSLLRGNNRGEEVNITSVVLLAHLVHKPYGNTLHTFPMLTELRNTIVDQKQTLHRKVTTSHLSLLPRWREWWFSSYHRNQTENTQPSCIVLYGHKSERRCPNMNRLELQLSLSSLDNSLNQSGQVDKMTVVGLCGSDRQVTPTQTPTILQLNNCIFKHSNDKSPLLKDPSHCLWVINLILGYLRRTHVVGEYDCLGVAFTVSKAGGTWPSWHGDTLELRHPDMFQKLVGRVNQRL